MTRPRHVPLRRCVACRESRPKRELVRLVRTGDGGWALDLRQRAGGRGTSLCPACALAAVRRDDAGRRDHADRLKGFRRAFRQDADAVTALLAEIETTLAAAVGSAGTADAVDAAPHAAATTATAATPEPLRPNGGMHG